MDHSDPTTFDRVLSIPEGHMTFVAKVFPYSMLFQSNKNKEFWLPGTVATFVPKMFVRHSSHVKSTLCHRKHISSCIETKLCSKKLLRFSNAKTTFFELNI